MGWLSGISSFLTHSVFDPVGHALGGSSGKGLGGDPVAAALQQSIVDQTAATKAASAKASLDAAAALKAQQDANLIAAAASVPAADSESARAAGDDQRRKLLQGSAFGIGLPDKFGAPPVGYRMLAGQ